MRSIGDEGAAAIGEALKVNKVLNSLELSFNWPGYMRALPQMQALAFALTACARAPRVGAEGAKTLASSLEANAVLTELNLRNNEVGDEGAKALASALKGNAVLTQLDMRGNDISGEAAQQLAAAVLASPSLEVFGKVPLKELRADALTELDLSVKDLGPAEDIVLVELLKVTKVLTKLDLNRNR